MTILRISTERNNLNNKIECKIIDTVTDVLVTVFYISENDLRSMISSIDMEGISFANINIGIHQNIISFISINNIDRIITIMQHEIISRELIRSYNVKYDNIYYDE